MTLPVDYDSEDYRFRKTLHSDILLTTENGYKFDIAFNGADVETVTGNESLRNACIIAIMTRYHELERISLYGDFGCRVHENVKRNANTLTRRRIEAQTIETLEAMRRIKKVNFVEVEQTSIGFDVLFNVTSVNDSTIEGGVSL